MANRYGNRGYRGAGTNRYRRRGTGSLAIIAVFVLLVCGVLADYGFQKLTQTTVTFTVQDKIVKFDSKGNSQYLIFTDHGVYKDVDSIWYLKFDSSDVYGQLQKGQTYTCQVTGWRIPLFSSYQNIIGCHAAA